MGCYFIVMYNPYLLRLLSVPLDNYDLLSMLDLFFSTRKYPQCPSAAHLLINNRLNFCLSTHVFIMSSFRRTCFLIAELYAGRFLCRHVEKPPRSFPALAEAVAASDAIIILFL